MAAGWANGLSGEQVRHAMFSPCHYRAGDGSQAWPVRARTAGWTADDGVYVRN
jgi:hypothetical protein